MFCTISWPRIELDPYYKCLPAKLSTPSRRILSGVLDNQFASVMRRAGVLSTSIDAAIDVLPGMRALAGPLRGQCYRALVGAAADESSHTQRILVLEARAVGAAPIRAIWYRLPSKCGDGFYSANGRSLQQALNPCPVARARLSSRFGERMHPISGHYTFHSGVDWAAPQGTPVRASGPGNIEFLGWLHGYGKTVILRHNQQYETVYAHLSRTPSKLRTGKRIARGDIIGYVGNTGWATGPHLHYEVRHYGYHINPLSASVGKPSSLHGTALREFKRYLSNLSNGNRNSLLPAYVAS
ncbi:M23 family metallopeptidase [Candidatus Vallotia lariciata]|uniref:M23 family metallopeptidase n=1 Tax=Candidatus Vallotia laricis TaxID=2018052 RepID=UPI001D00A553|nr:M23 family metallopeptidase [Candidatus Vallotia lariciata]